MDLITITTVETPHADVICEALSDAGITATRVAVRPANQWIQHKLRPYVDIQVPHAEVEAARAVLSHLELEAETAAVSQSRESGSHKSEDDLRLERDRTGRTGRPGQPTRALSQGMAFVISLLLPVAGPLYARARGLTVISVLGHVIGIAMLLRATSAHGWYRSDLHAHLGMMVFAVARAIDVIGTLDAVGRHNARLAQMDGQSDEANQPDKPNEKEE